MANPWDAEITVGAADVRRLIGTQFPDLDVGNLAFLAEGWDNAVWVVDDVWAFRFPRVSGAVEFLRNEIALLPAVAPLVPAAVPVPELIGQPDDQYPWPFYGARLIPGKDLVASGLADTDRVRVAGQLGRFLRRLHAIAAERLGPNVPRHPEETVADLVRHLERMDRCAAEGIWQPTAAAYDLVREAAVLDQGPQLVVSHGDIHVRHVLVDEGGDLAGVIDWGEIGMAPASVDLPIAYSGFVGDARQAFFAAYGEVPDAWHRRARAAGLIYSVTLALYANDRGDLDLRREARAGIQRAVAH